MKTRYLKWIPVINETLCTGCNQCVEACDEKMLEVRQGIAVLVWPNQCCSDGECVGACPEAVMRMAWVELDGNRNRGRWESAGRPWPGRVRGGKDYSWDCAEGMGRRALRG
jgi:Na+-translocating ferredoxin:NAD+ oxidoreductase RNF subunit RnfB